MPKPRPDVTAMISKQQRSPAVVRQMHVVGHLKRLLTVHACKHRRQPRTVELVRQPTAVRQLGALHLLTGQHIVQQHLRSA